MKVFQSYYKLLNVSGRTTGMLSLIMPADPPVIEDIHVLYLKVTILWITGDSRVNRGFREVIPNEVLVGA